MMIVTVDRIEKDVDLSAASNLGEVLDIISGDFAELDRIITELTLNGERLTVEINKEFMGRAVENITSLEVSTTALVDLAKEAIEDTISYIKDLKENVKKTSELFRQGNERGANEYYSTCLEGLKLLISSVQIINSYRTSLPEEAGLQEGEKELLEILNRMMNSQILGDWVALADYLEHEIIPFLDRCSSTLLSLKEKI